MIRIIDSMMGSGKTSYIIQMVNENPEKRFVYITPYLPEVERIKSSCVGFVEPEVKRGELKLASLNRLLEAGKNIVSTHALFKMSNRQTLDALRKWNYTLVIDEVMEVVSKDEFQKDDLPTILDCGFAHIDEETGFLVWDKEDYSGAYNHIKRLCTYKSVVVIDGTILVWVFPQTIFECFEDIYVCTYMFSSQVMRFYFDIHKIDYAYCSVRDVGGRNYQLVDYVEADDTTGLAKLIHIYTGKKNDIGTSKEYGNPYYLLSNSWYANNEDKHVVVKNNMVAYFKRDLKNSPSDVNLWTVFKAYQKDLQASPYTKGFLACNARAINNYRHKTAVAYAINKFMFPFMVKFFSLHGVKIGKEEQVRYALSELLQFIFRSAIRDGKEINLYIPSVRMRYALQDYLGLPHAD